MGYRGPVRLVWLKVRPWHASSFRIGTGPLSGGLTKEVIFLTLPFAYFILPPWKSNFLSKRGEYGSVEK
jgi:hypothetical protein